MGVAELAAGALGRASSSPLLAVGAGFIDLTPAWLKDFAIRHFGSDDKTVLLLGLGAGIVLAALAIGLLSRHRLAWGLIGLAAFGAVGVVAALTRPVAEPVDAVPATVGALAGMAALALLTPGIRLFPNPTPESRATDHGIATPADGNATGTVASGRTDGPERRPDTTGPEPATEPEQDAEAPRVPAPGAEIGRRRALLTGAGVIGVAVVSGVSGRMLLRRGDVSSVRADVQLPRPASPAPEVPVGAQVRVPGMTPFRTSNADFYRVDTALVLPQVDPRDWTLRIHGMVAHPVELTFDDLLRQPLIERDITLSCVSNQVGGVLAGNARWLGVPLAPLLRRAGVRSGADQILSRSSDGMTLSTPLESVLDGRDALLAVGMNGEPLPVAHGFPARMVVPGLYGYVSATKWVVDLKVTRFATDQAYWTRRGYAERAPVKTFSRIDVPKPFARLEAGPVAVAGTAWAQHRGVDAVEWQVDDGPWRPARLAPVPGIDTWRQWIAEWNALPGSHTLRVRATDRTGTTQPEHRSPPVPDGATGWHSVVVTVT
ncbi:molybdopterin-dependent oxidoreductase [Actinomadura decatromicini]|uniref:Molybdopterin-dependent oxidoreductase n=2 Tax=Actinomadura decatromicini TaxID=2604572 RepID=A0A5D3F773_9ACTN|nr:molybdopterin-dependent oxidoreductase [Actinomadura decatromicini]TYK44151.1 molybdopterin-dependent oxidoreductase [Actinomadura decatromicini]